MEAATTRNRGPRAASGGRHCFFSAAGGVGKEAGRSRRRGIPGQGRLYFPFCATGGLASGRAQAQTIRCFYAPSEKTPFRERWKVRWKARRSANRILRVRHLKQAEDMQACQILFLGQGAKQAHSHAAGGSAQCSDSDRGRNPGFLGRGWNDLLSAGRQQCSFRINLDAAESAKLKIGSRLLILAQTVVGESREK
jgi:hypothetical protein